MRLKDYIKKYHKWNETFCPEDYGYAYDEYDNGLVDTFAEWVLAQYGNSTTAMYLRSNREAFEA